MNIDSAGETDAVPPEAVIDFRWRIFLRVADAGSLSKAAAALAVPQSLVSRAISHLERQCGERLFVRTGRGVVLTEFGAQILARVTRLAADADLQCLVVSRRTVTIGGAIGGAISGQVKDHEGSHHDCVAATACSSQNAVHASSNLSAPR